MGNFQFNDNIDEDTAFSGVHATAQRTGLQLKTMNRALFQGVLQYNFLMAGHNSMKPPLCVGEHLQYSQQTLSAYSHNRHFDIRVCLCRTAIIAANSLLFAHFVEFQCTNKPPRKFHAR